VKAGRLFRRQQQTPAWTGRLNRPSRQQYRPDDDPGADDKLETTLIDIFVDNNKTERDETRKGRDLWRGVDPSGLQ